MQAAAKNFSCEPIEVDATKSRLGCLQQGIGGRKNIERCLLLSVVSCAIVILLILVHTNNSKLKCSFDIFVIDGGSKSVEMK
jgi:hypothetical protein